MDCRPTTTSTVANAVMAVVAEPPPTTPSLDPGDEAVLRRLSTLDRFLPLWIALAMAMGSCSARSFRV